MTYTSPGRIHTVGDFREYLQRQAPTLDCIEDLHRSSRLLAQSRQVVGRTACNRFCVQPSSRSMANADGSAGPSTLEVWERAGASTAGLIWCGTELAVHESGKISRDQMYQNSDIDMPRSLRELIRACRAGVASTGEDPDSRIIGLQLNHAGRFARSDDVSRPPSMAHHHPQLAIITDQPSDMPLLTDDQLKRIRDQFIQAANLAQSAGFDFVSLNCSHGYLLHELLAARTRHGDYGGSFDNRCRLLREIIEGIQQNVQGLSLGVQLSVTDRPPYHRNPDTGEGCQIPRDEGKWPYGFGMSEHDPDKADLFEPFALLAMLQIMKIRLVNVTIGSPAYCRHAQAPGTAADQCGYGPPVNPLDGVRRHIEATRACKQRYPDLNIIGNGYSWLQQYLPNVAAMEIEDHHADFIGLGRIMQAYPTMPRDLLGHGLFDATWLRDLFNK